MWIRLTTESAGLFGGVGCRATWPTISVVLSLRGIAKSHSIRLDKRGMTK